MRGHNTYYQTKKGYTGYEPEDEEEGLTEEEAAQAQVLYYQKYHAAKRKGCQCGRGKWIMFESKCADQERIEHVWDQLNDGDFGHPIRYYK